jgi:hypothetical protein
MASAVCRQNQTWWGVAAIRIVACSKVARYGHFRGDAIILRGERNHSGTYSVHWINKRQRCGHTAGLTSANR